MRNLRIASWIALFWGVGFGMGFAYRTAIQTNEALVSEFKSGGLVIGDTFSINSQILSEKRVINVYFPPGYSESTDMRLPVLYMPDGGLAEDFLHVAGLVQVGSGNGTMRPFILVGIQNTERRRDLTGPTANAKDKTIAPHVGGSAEFRRFLREELMPEVSKRYRTTAEKAIVGESLAGLFVIETLFLEPDLFDTYIAFDPSLWWNDQQMLKKSGVEYLPKLPSGKHLFFANSGESSLAPLVEELKENLRKSAPKGFDWHSQEFKSETHATIFHPACLIAFRTMFKPVGNANK
ncbi:alpha/beta hydrolase [Telmatocola sphagniphila]|uniref:Alpha/beta hydrolase n=1 Tax=Telmatocola sphagniphila TaxID=1123043 RepID=A0A8E6B9L5_9BACT|nr:alpha/beta hydrolase-fold protein [Telmatocola sphagniphila]QVL34261.1 alpha/beta hydrolase [Telmatocola sphagniphila]